MDGSVRMRWPHRSRVSDGTQHNQQCALHRASTQAEADAEPLGRDLTYQALAHVRLPVQRSDLAGRRALRWPSSTVQLGSEKITGLPCQTTPIPVRSAR